jgi:antitoxin component YwqK of YwqJK toxin-antitoxin module
MRRCWGLLLAAAMACSPPEGETRPLLATWPKGGVKLEATEAWYDGEWVKHGRASFFRQDGSPQATGPYERGSESGAWVEWLEDSTRGEGQYVDGQRSGEWTYWHKNGKVQEQGAYEAGRRVGVWKWWYASGVLRSEGEYASGKLSGRVRHWLPDGSPDADLSGTYKDGQMVSD